MRETQAIVERIKRVNRGYQRLELAVDRSLSALLPGQALLVRRISKDYAAEIWHPYLRDLWFPVDVLASNILVVEQPAREQFVPGQLLSLLGPIGKPLRFRQKLRNLLLLAYATPPTPLLMMLPPLLEQGTSLTMVTMGSARDYDCAHLPEEVEIIQASDDHSWGDMVMTLGWADQIFALVGEGPELIRFAEIMRLIRSRRSDVPANTIFGIFQRQLPCGVGACQACMLPVRPSARLQCLDGPAFDLTQLRLA
ncbi:MAG: hypothetical protein OXE95_10540 [Chloroflexi bacterium]|nr:hypothetical protein [Chloroflexota bacterium]MCY4247995.1 hypothetical protein [Chloroflexota bacterium]